MKPSSFEYFVPDTLEEALAIKAKHGDSAKPLAGGQSLIPAMNFRVAQPEILVDLNKLNDLAYIREENKGIQIGALTRQSTVEKSQIVMKAAPLIHETMPMTPTHSSSIGTTWPTCPSRTASPPRASSPESRTTRPKAP